MIKPLETVYAGYRFRSRLEARWAVFLDALGVKWEYEPQGFELPSGKCYLPDFRVKCYGKRGDYTSEPFDLFIEVKGYMTQDDADRIKEFVDCKSDIYDFGECVSNPVLVVGDIPGEMVYLSDIDSDCMDGTDVCQFNYETIDGDWFAAYPAAHNGHFYLMGGDSNYINEDDVPLVKSAYRKARQARFEHGEQPIRYQ